MKKTEPEFWTILKTPQPKKSDWSHVAITRNMLGMFAYVNGVRVYSPQVPATDISDKDEFTIEGHFKNGTVSEYINWLASTKRETL